MTLLLNQQAAGTKCLRLWNFVSPPAASLPLAPGRLTDDPRRRLPRLGPASQMDAEKFYKEPRGTALTNQLSLISSSDGLVANQSRSKFTGGPPTAAGASPASTSLRHQPSRTFSLQLSGSCITSPFFLFFFSFSSLPMAGSYTRFRKSMNK